MLSFKPLDATGAEKIIDFALSIEPSVDAEYLREVIESFLSLQGEDIESCAVFEYGCLLVRIFDMGRYSFVYPIPMCDSADEEEAVLALREYAVKEEIPLVITDVPIDCVGAVVSNFRHISLDIEDDEAMSYRATVLSELALLDGVPTLSGERIELSMLDSADASAYAALCRDREVNKFWGYDFRDDVSDDVCDDYFLNEATAEYNRSVALTLAVRIDGEFAGDAVLHAFDLGGCAEIAFRLMPKWQGRGLGRDLFNTLIVYARKIGLVRLRARVMKDNIRSQRLLRSVADECFDAGDVNIFEIEL
ncbi:MAG: GNAT family N-acetyltransferase [Clostridia bacterium]|nr:GNAT family N-acetyltransferase [Clostridia bacterium]